MKKTLLLLLVVALVLLAGGCGNKPYTAFGTVTDGTSVGIADVTVAVDGIGVATTNADGEWTLTEVTGRRTVTPSKAGFSFDPASTTITAKQNIANFIGTPIDVSNVALRVYAPASSFAHISRDIPQTGASEVIAEVRVKVDEQSSGTSWGPGLALYWGDNTHVKLNYQSSARWRMHSDGVTGFINNVTAALDADSDGWVSLRFKVNESNISAYVKTDEDWNLITESARPADIAIVPEKIIIGKAYGTKGATYSNLLLMNSAAKLGEMGTSYFADFKLYLDGVLAFTDGFTDLNAWDINIEPLAAGAYIDTALLD